MTITEAKNTIKWLLAVAWEYKGIPLGVCVLHIFDIFDIIAG